jgi:hypothetical protein
MELVRSICAAWERGDLGWVEWAHPEIEYVLGDVGRSPGRGLAGMAERWRGWLSSWEDFGAEVEGYRELDEERILVLHRLTGRGKTSGLDLAEVRSKGAALFHVRSGKVIRLVIYTERKSAFDDLGLAPESGSPGS